METLSPFLLSTTFNPSEDNKTLVPSESTTFIPSSETFTFASSVLTLTLPSCEKILWIKLVIVLKISERLKSNKWKSLEFLFLTIT